MDFRDACVVFFSVTCSPFIGTVPRELVNLAHLEYLFLNGDFQGTIPDYLGDIPKLHTLALVGKWSGTIPNSLERAPLAMLILSVRSFLKVSKYSIRFREIIWQVQFRPRCYPSRVLRGFNWTVLSNFDFFDQLGNDLEGTIPPSVGDLKLLVGLFLGENRISGTIPESLGSLPFLAELQLQNNKFSGTIPTSLKNLSHLRQWCVS